MNVDKTHQNDNHKEDLENQINPTNTREGYKTAVLIPAAGTGKRMGLSTPKQWVEIEGHPVLFYTVKQFYMHDQIDAIILIGREDDQSQVELLFKELRKLKSQGPKLLFTEGGLERQDSVRNGLIAALDYEYVLIHDGARPFISTALITVMIESVQRHNAVIPVVEVTDTIKRVSPEGIVLETPLRNELRAVQTPQAFQRTLLTEAFEYSLNSGFVGTDDASLVELYGYPVHCVQGERGNIKLTTPEDLEYAKRYFGRNAIDD